MAQLVKEWLTVDYTGEGNGVATFTGSTNTGADARVVDVSFVDSSRSFFITRRITQAGAPVVGTYTRLAYIEATGEQYINTGYVVQEDDIIEMDYITTLQSSADKMLFGCYDANGNLWFDLYSNTAYVRFGSGQSIGVTNGRMKYVVKMYRGEANVDGSKATLPEDGMPQVPLYLFARNNKNESASLFGHFQSRGFKITKQSGAVVMDLRPYKRDSDGVIGMLDMITGAFFANSGVGADFVSGGEAHLTDDYEIIDYVTFAKDKLYDLGLVKNTYTLEMLFQRSEKSATPYLYGCVTNPHTASVTAYLSPNGAWRFGTSYKGINANTTDKYYVVVKNGSIVYNFTTGTFTKATFTTPATVVLGGYRAASGSLTKNYQGKVYFYRIKEGDTLLVDWVPCRRLSDGTEGFWDCVTQQFVAPM